MSLATTSAGGLGGAGGGALGGGAAMAHHVNAVVARPAAAQPPPQAGIPTGPAGGVPPSMAALAADLVDKTQSISLKQVRNLSKYPIVAVDLYSSDPLVAMFPQKPKDPSEARFPSLIGKMKSHVSLKTSETAHKTLRKWLTKTKTYEALREDSLGPNGVVIEHPHQWLGARRVDDVPDFIQQSFTIVQDESNHAIAEDAATSVGVAVTNGTLDGTSAPTGDDFDRVVYKVRLHESKKALAVLPEEAVTLVFALARHHVSRRVPRVDETDEEESLNYPMAVPVPAWACHDAAIEALLDATGGSGVLFQRSMAALAGALLPGDQADEGNMNAIIERCNYVIATKRKECQKKDPQGTSFQYDPLLVLVGTTADGVECTAVQISAIQPSCPNCLFGEFKVLSSVSYMHSDPVSLVGACVKEIYANLERLAPEADGPVAFVTYGTSEDQGKIKGMLNAAKTSLDTWENVPVFSTKPECVSVGTAVLGAVSHGRIRAFTRTEDSNKTRAQLAIQIQNVAPTAVGVRMNYHGGAQNKWTPVKVIFDFDRRVPAGPYSIDLKATECAAIRNSAKPLFDDDLLEAAKKYEGASGIPEREKAALEFRFQVVQKHQRNGEWMNVEDASSPLTKTRADDEESKVACESVSVELSLGPTGIISSCLVGDRESVVQATKTARNSKMRYYLGILAAVLFFGGFLVKSFVEERIFERDTQRLLAYYKHAIPGSLADGDIHNARYLVWKYRGKKGKLWKALEIKYSIPVLHAHEWEDAKDASAEDGDDEENLDDPPQVDETKQDGGSAEGDDDTPDL